MHLKAPELVTEHGTVGIDQLHVIGVFLKEAATLQTVNVEGAVVFLDIVVKVTADRGKIVEF